MIQSGAQSVAATSSSANASWGSDPRRDAALAMHAADQPPDEPPLHGHPARLASASDSVNPLWMLLTALAFAAITALFVLVGM